MTEHLDSDVNHNEPGFHYRKSDGKKTPIKLVLQHDEQDCGAAVLATIAKIHGIDRPLSFFRDLLDIGPYGASLYGIIKASHHLGFKTFAMQTDFKSLQGLLTPMICAYADHVVVVYEVSDKRVLVGDPWFGVLQRSREAFEKDWDGYVLLFNPTPALDKLKAVKHERLQILRELISENRSILWKILIISALTSVAGIILPLVSGKVFDLFSDADSRLHFRYFVFVLLTVKAVGLLMAAVRRLATRRLDLKISFEFSEKLADKVLGLPLRAFKSRTIGDYINRFGDVFSVGQILHGSLLNGLLDFVTAIIFLIALLFFQWKLAVLAALIGLLILAGSAMLNQSVKTTLYELARMESETYTRFHDVARNTVTIRLFNAQDKYRSALAQFIAGINRLSLGVTQKQVRFNFLIQGLLLLASIEIVFLIVDVLQLENFSMGDCVAASGWIMQFIMPVAGLGGLIQELASIFITFERLDEIFVAKSEAQPSTAASAPSAREPCPDAVRFENVSFRYGNEESPEVVNNISFHVPRNAVTAVVGASGSGKTTTLQLIPRLYDVSSGRILLNGRDIRSYPLRALRNEISYVSQDTTLLSGTFIENIAIHQEEVDEARLLGVLRQVDLYDFVMGFPKGLRTKISEDEKGLSGGQKQRIAIARALYKSPPIFILDEPTSALDGVTESRILKSITGKPDRTIIFSSHRLSVISLASHVVVIDRGEVLEFGSVQELLKNKGPFYGLFKDQIQRSQDF